MLKKIIRRFLLPTPKLYNKVFTFCLISFSVILGAEYFDAIPNILINILKESKFILIAVAVISKYAVKKELLTKDDIIHFWEKDPDLKKEDVSEVIPEEEKGD